MYTAYAHGDCVDYHTQYACLSVFSRSAGIRVVSIMSQALALCYK